MHRICLLALVLIGLGFSNEAKARQVCENVVIGMAPGGGGGTPIFEQRCQWLAGAVAFNPSTREFSSAWNYSNAEEALAYVMGQCGSQCVGQSFYEDFAYIAISDDDSAWGVSMVSAADAIARCQVSGGVKCDAVIGASSSASALYWPYGALAYDVESGASASIRNQLRRSDAKRVVQERCARPGCWTYVFQTGHGAIARSKDGQLFGAWNDSARGLLGNANREARKACKAATGDKHCEVVVEGPAGF
jgi:hypothetical protein